ncbi:erythromycin esterase family protein [Ferrimonas sediminicola]|uniref:Erythromycin esterase family protein n=1 Tax=Ferrimonas sediminicola TaxID=2569538 RepID=A0A4U1BGD3_9GAMM|nr:erythromycin esterase family protein [Ferrimonas sediminicola]TKB50265.1 erythromycin esterase family protein [Ferrimonas sediminicola]
MGKGTSLIRLWVLGVLVILSVKSWACEPLPAELAAIIGNNRPLLLGEIHGSVQAPKWVEHIVCNQLKQRPTILAIELLAVQTDVNGNKDQLAQNMATSFQWQQLHTGKTSEAIFDLLQTLLPLRQRCLTLVMSDDHGSPKALRMANKLKPYLHHDSRLIVYGGNWHTKVTHDTSCSEGTTNMGAHLKEWGADPLSINLLPSGGSVYNHQEQGPKVYPVKERKLTKDGILISASEASGYHWHLNIGRVSPSLPRVR